jgi:hypothetical protein
MDSWTRRASVLAVLLGVTLGVDAAPEGKRLGEACTVDQECQDDSFCNGQEQCDGTCIRAPLPGCMAGEQCDEANDRCIVHRTDADSDGHNSQATGGDDCDDYDRNAFPGNTEVWDDADHDEDCNAYSHGVPAVFGTVGAPGRGQACSGEKVIVLTRSADGTDTFSETSCGAGMACGGSGVCVSSAAGYSPPPSWPLPQGNQAHPRHDAAATGMMAPHPMRPLMPAAPVSVAPVNPKPVSGVRPVGVGIAKPCPPGLVRDAVSGACAARACPPGTVLDTNKGVCTADSQH